MAMLRREFYQNRRRNVRRNAIPMQLTFQHPTEYLIYSIDAKTANEPYLVCPVCDRRVQKLFTFAHDEREAGYKFSQNDCACGYDTASNIADEEMVVLYAGKGRT